MKFLIIGCGSIGQRHIRNLQSMGHEVILYDPDEEKLSTLLLHLKNISNAYSNINRALEDDFDAALICSPTSTHIENALRVVEAGRHIFIEKPISHTLSNLDLLQKRVEKRNLVCFNACNVRYLNCVKTTELLLNRIGKILSVSMDVGFYLPYWHPKEDYKTSYSARKSLGGGVIFDNIHELDILLHLFGDVSKIFCVADKISNLEIDTEDYADILLKFDSGINAKVHFDYIQKTYKRMWTFIGTEGEIVVDLNKQEIKIYGARNNVFRVINESINYDRNNAFLNEMRDFIDCIELKRQNPNDISTSKKTLELALACHKSAETGNVVKIHRKP